MVCINGTASDAYINAQTGKIRINRKAGDIYINRKAGQISMNVAGEVHIKRDARLCLCEGGVRRWPPLLTDGRPGT